MARLKRKSPALQIARERLAGLKKFRTEPDFGPALSVPAYETEINGYAADELLVDALRSHVKERAGPWKYPRWIEVRPDLPRTATGKIQRFKLRD